MRFLFVTWDGGGNVMPLLALGPLLRQRGHSVTVLGTGSALAPRFAAVGIEYSALPAGSEWGRDAPAVAAAVRSAIDEGGVDVALVDYMQPDALCGAEMSTGRVVAFVHTLYRTQAAGARSPMGMAFSVESVNTLRSKLGLDSIEQLPDLFDRTALVLVAGIDGLDGDGDLPSNVRFVGPLLEPPGPDAGWRAPWPATDLRPLVVVSLGTTDMGEAALAQRLLDAVAELPVHALLTIGEHLDRSSFSAPDNAVVSGYVRHAAVLPHAAVFVTHAGHGGVMSGLANGVPMLCLPLGREQPSNAAAVESVGAGRVLPPEATVEELRQAIESLLATPFYAEAARTMAERIATARPGVAAVEALESL